MNNTFEIMKRPLETVTLEQLRKAHSEGRVLETMGWAKICLLTTSHGTYSEHGQRDNCHVNYCRSDSVTTLHLRLRDNNVTKCEYDRVFATIETVPTPTMDDVNKALGPKIVTGELRRDVCSSDLLSMGVKELTVARMYHRPGETFTITAVCQDGKLKVIKTPGEQIVIGMDH